MAKVVYAIVEHDGGWAYRLDGVYSETFPTRSQAAAAAADVAARQAVPGETETISWEDADGHWHEERESGSNRPHASIFNGENASPRSFGVERAPIEASYGLLSLLVALLADFLISSFAHRPGWTTDKP